MILDAIIYISIAVTGYLMTQWGSDEAGKFISLQSLFWLKTGTGCVSAGSLALKMFRSTTYADAKAKANGKENGYEKVNGNGGGLPAGPVG